MASNSRTRQQRPTGPTGNGFDLPAEPAWLISPADGFLLAASACGAKLLGLGPGATAKPLPLDRAMPALAELVSLISSGDLANDAPVMHSLLFWTSNGPRLLASQCHLVTLPDGRNAVAVSPQIEPTRPVDPEPTQTPPQTKDTAATLTGIAARTGAELHARSTADRGEPVLAPPMPVVITDDDAPAGLSLHLAQLAHELRTPLGAIATMSEIIRDERFGALANPRYLDYARSIHDSARHLLALTEVMLEQDALTRDRPVLTFVDLDLNSLALHTLASLRPMATDAGLILATRLAQRLPHVVADQRSMRQILLNLLTNAIKFTPRGGTIHVATAYAKDGQLRVVVGDTGRGMSADARARAGNADAVGLGNSVAVHAQRRAGGGYGLGLPLVHALAAANGARVSIDSAPGRGTQVSIVFSGDRVVPV